MKHKKKWFYNFLKNVYFSTTNELNKMFKGTRFVVISQKDKGNFILRKIAFIYGPYILCLATNKIKKNEIVNKWTKINPEIPFGKILSKCKYYKRLLISKTSISRKYKIIGDVESEIEEIFFDFKEIKVAAFCGEVTNPEKDIIKAKKFVNKQKADIFLFPETFPYSRSDIKKNIFPRGTIFGKYSNSGPETFFVGKDVLEVKKSTLFANEKLKQKKDIRPFIYNYNGIKIAVLICYDLLNPGLSYALSKKEIDLILVPSMIPKKDVKRWENFIYSRGQENECPIILVSNEDKRRICSNKILFFDPIEEKVNKYSSPQKFSLKIGKRILESPKVNWNWLLKNKVYGPFSKDF
jgi:predicted amidohydrolase